MAANQESAIVVSGLKPNHFYNVRVIAVGSNNFQAGSRVIRLRTFGSDGRPQLGSARLPSNFFSHEQPNAVQGDHPGENGVPRNPVLNPGSAPPDSVPTLSREGGNTPTPGTRRNTLTRRRSPSATSIDGSVSRPEAADDSEQTLPELTQKFEDIRKETDEIAALITREENDNKRHLEELETEKQRKRTEQKKKEEQTEKLKREVNATDRSMRNSMQRKTQKEKMLKDKQNERAKLHDSIAKWEQCILDMRKEQEGFDSQKGVLESDRDKKLEALRQSNSDIQQDCSRLEAELKEKRDKVRELEDARKRLPGGEDDSEWREKDTQFRRERQRRQRELNEALIQEHRINRKLDDQLRVLSIQVGHIPGTQPGTPAYGMRPQPNPLAVEFDNSPHSQFRARSRNGHSLSNVSASSALPPYSQIDPAATAPNGFAGSRANAVHTFAQGPFMDMPPLLDESALRATTAPLSPSATALLPSSILDDLDDDHSPTSKFNPDFFAPPQPGSPKDDPQSPVSSNRSASVPLSSPQDSSQNLPFPAFGTDNNNNNNNNDQRSPYAAPDTAGSPVSNVPPTNKLSNFFNFQRSRNPKASDEGGPALGSLKSGQSQSFPRQTDETDPFAGKRRTSLSGHLFNRNSAGPGIAEGHAAHARGFSVRTLNPFSSSSRAQSTVFADRDPSSPRPSSIASSDFPRPSTDNGSIWGQFHGEGIGAGKQSRIWSPDVSWSGNPSRRTSVHGSPAALKTTLASADDEILDEEMLPNVSRVGVIGSRPPASSKPFPRLNPNAPAFIGSLFRAKPDKDKETPKDKDKDKDAKDKAKAKDKEKPKDKTKGASSIPETPLTAPPSEGEVPSDSRKSRDALSVHTQTSISASISESHESLSLEKTYSNTPSEPASVGVASSVKDDNVVRKLFRKSSSSKFSLPGRLGGKDGSGLFKKGPSSATSAANSDKGVYAEGPGNLVGELEDTADGASALGRSFDSGAGSPGLGPTLSNPKLSKDSKAGSARWLSFSKKGKKEKESLELERDRISESDGAAAALPEEGK